MLVAHTGSVNGGCAKGTLKVHVNVK